MLIATHLSGFGAGTVDAGGGGGFSPDDLTLTGWWDPSDLSTLWKDESGTTPVTTDGDVVARMDDKSGNSRHFLQSSSGARFTYKTSGGLHWLESSGAAWMTTTAALSSFYGTTEFEAMVVARPDGASTSTTPINAPAFLHGDEGAITIGAPSPSNSRLYSSNYDGSVDFTFVSYTTSADILAYAFHQSGTLYCGTSAGSEATATSGNTNHLGSGDELLLFTNYSQSHFITGRFYGAAISATVLSTGDRASLKTWLGAKAGLTL